MSVNEKMKKALSILLCLCMLVQNCPVMAFAATGDGLCEHHTAHTEECGYVPAVAGVDCTHVHDTAACGYVEAVQGRDCACEATDENGALVHTEGCGYVAGTEGAACTHVHDAAVCQYVAAVEGKPCTFVTNGCPDCMAAAAPVCTCETKCAEGAVKADCAVCAAENADLTACTGKAPHTHAYTGEKRYEAKDASVHTVTASCPDCPEAKTEVTEESHSFDENGLCTLCGFAAAAECSCVEKCGSENINESCALCAQQGEGSCTGGMVFKSGRFAAPAAVCSCAVKCGPENINADCALCSQQGDEACQSEEEITPYVDVEVKWGTSADDLPMSHTLAEALTNELNDPHGYNYIQLQKDIVLTSPVVLNRGWTFDLNGHSITANGCDAFQITGHTFTIVGSGSVTATGEGASAVRVKGGTVTLSSGKLTGTQSAVRVEGGSVTVNGGTYQGGTDASIDVAGTANLSVAAPAVVNTTEWGCINIRGSGGTVTVTGDPLGRDALICYIHSTGGTKALNLSGFTGFDDFKLMARDNNIPQNAPITRPTNCFWVNSNNTIMEKLSSGNTYSLRQYFTIKSTATGGGSVSHNNAKVSPNSKVTLTVTPGENNVLESLTITANGTPVNFTAGSDGTYTFTMPSSDVEVNAKFQPRSYAVTFDPNGGTGTMEPQSAPEGSQVTLTANAFTHDASKFFTGWNTASDGSGTAYPDGAAITLTGDLDLYAQWTDAAADVWKNGTSTYYATLEEALPHWTDGAYLGLRKDTAADITAGTGSMLILNGCTLTGNITAGGNTFLTIQGSGTVSGSITLSDKAYVTLSDCTVTGGCTVNGGSLDTRAGTNAGTVTLNSGILYYQGGSCAVTINGGGISFYESPTEELIITMAVPGEIGLDKTPGNSMTTEFLRSGNAGYKVVKEGFNFFLVQCDHSLEKDVTYSNIQTHTHDVTCGCGSTSQTVSHSYEYKNQTADTHDKACACGHTVTTEAHDFDANGECACGVVAYPVWVAGQQVVKVGDTIITGNDNVTYDPVENILTLNGATVTISSSDVIKAEGNLNLVLAGNNSVTGGAYSRYAGIRVTGDLTISGTGSVKADGKTNGIEVTGNLTISSSVESLGGDGAGIQVKGNVEIIGGKVDTIGCYGSGIFARGSITITDSTVDASSDEDSGISANSGISIKGASHVQARGNEATSATLGAGLCRTARSNAFTACEAGTSASGTYLEFIGEGHTVSYTDSTQTQHTESCSCGLYAASQEHSFDENGECACGMVAYPVWVAGQQVVGKKDDTSIKVREGVTYVPAIETGSIIGIIDATLTLNGVNISGSEDGIKAEEDLELVLEGQNTVHGSNNGINVTGNLTISGSGSVDAGSNTTNGIYTTGSIGITSGTVNATGEKALYTEGRLWIDGGTVNVTGSIYSGDNVFYIRGGTVAVSETIESGDELHIYGNSRVTAKDLKSTKTEFFGSTHVLVTNPSQGSNVQLVNGRYRTGSDASFTEITGQSIKIDMPAYLEYMGEDHKITYTYHDNNHHTEICDCGSYRLLTGHSFDENGECACGWKKFPVWVEGTQVEGLKTAESIVVREGVTYVPATDTEPATLTLIGVAIRNESGEGIKATDDLNLMLVGTNIVSDTKKFSGGIFIEGNLTIKGNGELNVIGGHGIYSLGNVTINSGTVAASGSSNTGICSSGSVNITGGTVTAVGGGSAGINGNSVTVSGGAVSAISVSDCGIYSSGTVSISNANVTAEGDNIGINAGDAFTSTDSTVTAKGSNGAGIDGSSVSISGGTVIASSTSASGISGNSTTINGSAHVRTTGSYGYLTTLGAGQYRKKAGDSFTQITETTEVPVNTYLEFIGEGHTISFVPYEGETHILTCDCDLSNQGLPHNWDETGYCQDCKTHAQVAISDGSYFADIANAIGSWNDGETLTLLADTNFSRINVVGSKMLDLNGQTHTGEIVVGNNCGLTVNGPGKITNTIGITVVSLGTLTINGATIENTNGIAVVNNGETVTLNGGELIGGTYAFVGGGLIAQSGTITGTGESPAINLDSASTNSLSGDVTVNGDILVNKADCAFTVTSKLAQAWKVRMNTPGIFAKPGQGMTLEESWFVSGKEGYVVAKDGENLKLALGITKGMVTLDQTESTYNGNVQTPTIAVKWDENTTLTESTDYTVTWPKDPIDVGTYTFTITGINGYTGTVELDYTITAKEVSIIGAEIQAVTYDPDGYTLTVTDVKFDGVVDGEALAYTAEAALGNTNAAGEQDATVTVSLKDSNYTLATTTYQTKVTINKAEPEIVWNSGYTNSYGRNMYITAYINGVNGNLLPGTAIAAVHDAEGNVLNSVTCTKTDSTGAYGFNWLNKLSDGTYLPVGNYAVKLTYQGDANYNAKTVELVNYTISKADPEIGTVGCEIPLFDTTAASDIVLTRTDMSVDGTLVLTDSVLTAGEGTYNWKFTPADGENYNTITGTVVLNVTADVLEKIEVSGTLEKNSYSYGDTFSIDGLTVTATYTSGATEDVTGLVSFDSTLAVGQTSVELTYQGKTCVIDGITVARKQLVIDRMAWDIPENAVYSGNAYTATLTGNLPDGVAVTKTGDTATNAGSYTAKAQFSLAEGYSADNYEIVNGGDLTADWSIARKNISGAQITLGTALTYNGKQQTQAVAKVEIDGLTATYTVSGNTGTDAKGYTLTVTGTGNFEGTAAADWSIARKNISGAAITLGDSLSYNGKEQTQMVTGVKIGDLTVTYDVTDNKQLGAGSYILTVTGNGNFEGSATADWSIARAKLTITANDNSITYGDVPAANGVTGTGFVSGESFEDLSGELAYSCSYEQFGNAGTYKITPSGMTSNNYEITFADGTLTVNAKAITVTADAVSKTYGEADPALTYKVEGLVNGDELTGKLKRAAGENVGDYAIEQNTLTAGNNYRLIYTGAKLTINAKAITAADVKLNGSLTYNGKEQIQPITVTAGITYEVSGNKATDAGAHVLSVKGTGNYTGSVTLDWTIAKANLTITADSKVIYIGEKLPTLTYTASGLMGGDKLTKEPALTTNADAEHAGSYTITAANADAGVNYAITYVGGTLTIMDQNTEVKTKVETAALTEVPDGLKNTKFNTVEAIKQELTSRIVAAFTGFVKENMAHYDVTLQLSLDGGVSWILGTEENFPTEGITLVLPYPAGTNAEGYDFVVSHMFTVTSQRLGITAGDVELPKVTETASGIRVTLKGLSPVTLAWKATEFDVKIAGATNGTVSTNVSKATSGTEVSVTVTPKYGYKMATLTVKDASGKSYAVSTDNSGKYYFTMPSADVMVTATFSKISTYTPDHTNPKTGDDFQLAMWSCMAMTSLLGMAALTLGKKRYYQR